MRYDSPTVAATEPAETENEINCNCKNRLHLYETISGRLAILLIRLSLFQNVTTLQFFGLIVDTQTYKDLTYHLRILLKVQGRKGSILVIH